MLTQFDGNIIANSFQDLWEGFIDFVPELITAIVIFLIGWIIAIALGKLVAQIIRAFKIDVILEKVGFKAALERANMRLDSGLFVGELVKWFFIIVFLMAAAEIVGLTELTAFLKDVLVYIPNVIVASLILLAGVLIANFIQRLVKASIEAGGLKGAEFLAAVSRWAIWIFAIIAALIQLKIAPALINTLFTGFVAMLAIAGGLAFGLGGKDNAAKIVDKISKQTIIK